MHLEAGFNVSCHEALGFSPRQDAYSVHYYDDCHHRYDCDDDAIETIQLGHHQNTPFLGIR